MLCKFHPESPDSFCHQVWPQMWRQVSVKMRISVATVGAVALIHWSVVVRGKGDERCERVTRFGFKPFAFPIVIIPLVVSIRFVAYIREDSPVLKFPKLWGRLRFRVKRSDIRKITFWQSVAGEHSVGCEQSGAVSSVSTSLWLSWVWQSGWRCYEPSSGCLTVHPFLELVTAPKKNCRKFVQRNVFRQRWHMWCSSTWPCFAEKAWHPLKRSMYRLEERNLVVACYWVCLDPSLICMKSSTYHTVMKIDEASLPWMALGVHFLLNLWVPVAACSAGPQEWVYEELRRAQVWWKMREAVWKRRFCRESSTCPQFLVEIVSMLIQRWELESIHTPSE